MSDIDNQFDTNFLDELDKESDIVNKARRRGYAQRFALEDGEAAILRYIPYQFEETRKPWARIARHWVGSRPYLCTRDSEAAQGGERDCPLCKVTDDLNRDRNRDVSDRAYRMMAVKQWLMYAIVYEKFDNRGKQSFKAKTNAELLKPLEHWFHVSDFSEWLVQQKNFTRRYPDVKGSIFNVVDGCDLYVSKSKRGIRFDLEKQQSIGKDPEAMLATAIKNIDRTPDLPVEGDDLEDLIIKIEDICQGRRSAKERDSTSSSRRSRDIDYDDDDRKSSRRGDDRGPARGDDRGPSRTASRDDRSQSRARDDDRSPSRSSREPADDRRPRDDDRPSMTTESRAPADDRRAPRDDRAPADDRRARSDDRAPADDRRAPADDRRASRDEPRDSRTSTRSREPADDRRSSSELAEDRRSSQSEPDDRRDFPRERDRNDPLDDPVDNSEDGGDETPVDRRERAREDDDPPPPPVSTRGAPSLRERREPPPPPARAGSRESQPAGSPPPPRESKDDDEDNLPEGDKEKAPPTPPKEGEIVNSKPADPQTTTTFKSTLSNALKNRISQHSQRPTA